MNPPPPQPNGPPPGQQPDSGQWVWNGTAWKWTAKTDLTNTTVGGTSGTGTLSGNQGAAKGGPSVVHSDSISRNPGPFNNVNLGNATAHGVVDPGPNPFGDQYSSNLQYTPFGLSPSQQQPGQYGLPSAFGGLSFNSDLLVPQLESIRMQRIMQTYSPQGGNNGGR